MNNRPTTLMLITTVPQSLAFFAGQIGYLKTNGFTVHVLTSPGDLLDAFASREAVCAHVVEMPRRITPFRDVGALFRTWRSLRRTRPEIVHAHTPKGGLLGTIAAWLARVPVRIYHIHGLPFTTASGYKRSLLRLSEKTSCRLAHQVLCVSHSVRRVVIAERLCPASKVKVLGNGTINGVDALARFNPANIESRTGREARARLGIAADALVIGFVGRVVRDKGLQELSAAWEVLRAEFEALHLLIVGDFEPQDPIPENIKNLLATDPRIHLIKHTEEVETYYAAMDIVVLPSYREGFPSVPLEAAALRLPVVATRIQGCVEAVVDGATGLLVPVRDADALAGAVRRYVSDPALREAHGRAGRERVLRMYRREDVWESLLAEYGRLLRDKQLPVPSLEPCQQGISGGGKGVRAS
jgi:glycosyltransferase involved in cell wall biosynthesis